MQKNLRLESQWLGSCLVAKTRYAEYISSWSVCYFDAPLPRAARAGRGHLLRASKSKVHKVWLVTKYSSIMSVCAKSACIRSFHVPD